MTRSIVVVGAGITGAFTAYFLSGSGNRVIIVDPDEEENRASFNNPGGINPLHGPGIPGVMAPFAMFSYRTHIAEWPAVTELSGTDFDGRYVTRVFVAMSMEEVPQLHKAGELYEHAQGFIAEWLDVERLRVRDPRISSAAVGGLWVKGNAAVDPRNYNCALIRAAYRRGAEHVAERATGVGVRDNRVYSLCTDSKEVPCDALVLATGACVDWIRTAFGTALPVRPVRGDLLLAEDDADVPEHDVVWKHYGAYRRSATRFWLGGTFKEMGFNCCPTKAEERKIIDGVSVMLPALSQARVVDHVAGLRPMTPDGMPIVGRMPRYENVYLALGSGSKGMLLGSGIGKAVAGMILNENLEVDVGFLGPERFPEAAYIRPSSPTDSAG